VGRGSDDLFCTQSKLNAVARDRSDFATAYSIAGGDVELLPNLGAQNASQMQSMLADQGSSVSVYFVGNPAATGHRFRSQVSDLSKCSHAEEESVEFDLRPEA
jgi:hypothetical protein